MKRTLLDRDAAAASQKGPSDEGFELGLDHDRRVSVQPGGRRMTLQAPGGAVELEIVITADGPVLRMPQGLAIEVDGDLSLTGDRVRIEGRESLELRSHGPARIDADGRLEAVAEATELRARAGNVDLKANDDVRAQGERIRLNC